MINDAREPNFYIVFQTDFQIDLVDKIFIKYSFMDEITNTLFYIYI